VDDGTLLCVNDVGILRAGEKHCWLEIVLDEGKNRHIRRLLEALDIKVLRLVRVAIGPVQLGGLAKGRSRALSAAELQAIAADLSRSTDEPS
jgi:23S rRNA pseudouridine2605 synthase